MRELALGLKTSLLNGGSFLQRIRENLQSVWSPPLAPMTAIHVPIHLLEEKPAPEARAAKMSSAILHMVICVVLVWSVAQRTDVHRNNQASKHDGWTLPPAPKWLLPVDKGSMGLQGESGGHDTLPPTAGRLAPMSRSALISPHLTDSHPHELVVPVKIASPDAPEFVSPVSDLGLPWMTERNNSEGRGENGIGNGKYHGMGDGPGDGAGMGKEGGVYAPAASSVICRVCPEPMYSDEARKTKVQGSVILSVLVGADGRAKDIRVIRGLGMGLDENAIQTVRNWVFIPAKDASERPVASWIKVETMFRLF